MTKYKLDVQDEVEAAEAVHAGAEHNAPEHEEVSSVASSDDMIGKAATIAVVAAGVALFEVALIPGMVIGVAATLAPNVLPKLGHRMKPMLHSTMRGAYKLGRRARSAVSEAQEQLQDIAAEVKAEQIATDKDVAAAVATAR